MNISECIKNSRAVRFYEKKPLPEHVVLSILEAGRAAGSGKNMQLWHFIVVTDGEKRRALAATGDYATHFGRAAFGVVIVSEVNPYVPGIAYFDAGRAAQNMMLAGTELGVGCCPAGFRSDPAEANRLLQIPEDKEIIIALAFGYADKTRHKDEVKFRKEVLERQGRKPLDNLVSENVFGKPWDLSKTK